VAEPLYTPLSGSWLNMAESIQRILKRRALEGQHPQTPAEIIAVLEATVRGWHQAPTPFVWGGKRALRRAHSRQRYHRLRGSGGLRRSSAPSASQFGATMATKLSNDPLGQLQHTLLGNEVGARRAVPLRMGEIFSIARDRIAILAIFDVL
jgi:hypothetical protein